MPTEDFQWFPKIFKNCQKIILRTFQHFLIFSEEFWRFLKTSDNFWRLKKIKMLESHFKHIGTISKFVQRFSKTSEDFQWFPKISRNSENAGRSFWALCDIFWFFQKTSVWRFPKTSKISEDFQKFGNLSQCLFLFSLVIFPKFSKEFPNSQQRRHELLHVLLVTDQPLFFFHVPYILVYKSNFLDVKMGSKNRPRLIFGRTWDIPTESQKNAKIHCNKPSYGVK